MRSKILFLLAISLAWVAQAQHVSEREKKRLDFAKTYFEVGGNFSPSFTGKRLVNDRVEKFKNAASMHQYLNWGAFHFWGHAEFYVSFPLTQVNFQKSNETDFKLTPYVVTGARYYPWAFQERKIRPYVGASWGSMEFQQKNVDEEDEPLLSKDFMLIPETGVVYGYRGFMLRLGLRYIHDHQWQYPLSKSTLSTIKTPKFDLQIGLNYSFESSRNEKPETKDRWNNYPRVSKIGHDARRSGDLFIGIGPSLSFSLIRSSYNQIQLPHLKNRLASSNFFDIAIGYQFNRLGWFTALSFRNPTFETKGHSDKQTIRKTSLALEACKFLTDYTGFAPYVGINLAYDHLDYRQTVEGSQRGFDIRGIEPGITVGWDIVPGKTDEALILRTNLRWYPFSSFEIDGMKFDFSQLEYNLIQAVFYPGRLIKKGKRNSI